MKIFITLFIVFMIQGGSATAKEAVILLGHFSNMKTSAGEDPHLVSGYSVSLYWQEGTLFGSIAVAVGSLEAVQGRLYDIKFNPANKKFCFKAKYVRGWTYDKHSGPDGREAREVITFAGTLTTTTLAGTIAVKDGYQAVVPAQKMWASMKKLKNDYKPVSIEAWGEMSYLDVKW